MTLGSYIFIDMFHLSTYAYSLAYALTAAVAVIGPFLYLALLRVMKARELSVLILTLLVISGIAMLAVGPFGAIPFFLTCLPFGLAESMARPCAYLILLRAAKDTAGSASALINFGIGFACALGTPLVSLPFWPDDLFAMGALTLIGGLVALFIVFVLIFLMRSNIFSLVEES